MCNKGGLDVGTGSYINQVFFKNLHRCNLEREKEYCESMMDFISDQIKALVCMTPRDIRDENDCTINWEQSAIREVKDYLDEYGEYIHKLYMINHVLEFPDDLEDELEDIEEVE